jgi:sphingomyelin phosphodiesterase 2
MPEEINILTLNCWGLKYISKLQHERLLEIGKRIATAEPTPQIVGLQELWTHEDYVTIRKETRHILPYGKLYYGGIFGAGLAILSKWPIEESSMVPYRLNGRPTAFFRGDWYVGKGVACARIRIGSGPKDIVEVFTTHVRSNPHWFIILLTPCQLHAPYEVEPHDSYICHRTAQAWEIAKLIRGAADRGHLAVALGDFNMIPLSLAHRLVTSHAPVQDVWRTLHPDSSLGAAIDKSEKARMREVPTAAMNLSENGITCDSVLNTWRWSKEEQQKLGPGKPAITVPLSTSDPKAKRLDYIFAGDGKRHGEAGAWIVESAYVGMTEPHPTLQCSLSDHFSVGATLRWSGIAGQDGNGVLQSPPVTHGHTESGTEKHRALGVSYLPPATYDEILEMIYTYTIRERKQRRWRLYHFIGSFFIAKCCLVAIWWSPRNFVSFLLMLLSTLGLSAGVIDGLIGGLFVGNELRALKEFEWEIKNARGAAGGVEHDDEHEVTDW